MPRRLLLACVGLMLTAANAGAQSLSSTAPIPSRTALARVGLDLHWVGMVPVTGAEKVTSISIDTDLLFAQTNMANFFAFEAESGRLLWTAHLGRATAQTFPASANSRAVFVTNSNHLFALDRRTGRQIWMKELTDLPTSPTAANEERVIVGLQSGKVPGYDVETGAPDWFLSTNGKVTSRPQMTERVLAVGSQDGKVYVTRSERYVQLYRFSTSGKVIAPLGAYDVRTLLIPSTDHVLYAIDLFTGEEKWKYATGSTIVQEPLVVDKDVYVVNDQGQLSSLDAETGSPRWTISTLGGRLLSVSSSKVYLESRDQDLFVVDRASGRMVFDPRTTYQRSGINLREFDLGPTNHLDDRLYFAMKSGLIVCLREAGQVRPRYLRDKNAKPFGYIPPEGYPDPDAVPLPTAPVEEPEPANP